MKIVCLFLIAVTVALSGCATSRSETTTATGEMIHPNVAAACRQIVDDLKIPNGMKVVIGPIVAKDPDDNKDKVVGASEKIGSALHAELSRRGIAMIERRQLESVLAEQKVTMSALFQERHRIGGLLKSDYIIVGMVRSVELHPANRATLDFKCDHIQEGRTVTASSIIIEINSPTSELKKDVTQDQDDFAPRYVLCADTTCNLCQGQGVYDCKMCNGTGIIGSVKTCTACNGQGITICTQCGQTGRCQVCQGAGYMNGIVCNACQGGGLCPAGCEAGKLKCSICKGKGEIKKLCTERRCKDGKIKHLVPQY